MNHKAFWCALCLVFFAVPLVVGAAEQPRSYADSDLKKYRNPSDGTQGTVSVPKEKSASGKNSADVKDKEYWCREGAKHAKIVEKAQSRVRASEAAVAKKRESADRKPGDKKAAKQLSDEQKRLAKDQKVLAAEEAELASLENRAHRKSIPPGWLKCNTEF
ncbi:MAG TPA: hypothetical protein VLH56_07030 [Dissulfurispiraceae bacterium]|nr:hypothetical protein [Dissulfurispiraceae bacterium]